MFEGGWEDWEGGGGEDGGVREGEVEWGDCDEDGDGDRWQLEEEATEVRPLLDEQGMAFLALGGIFTNTWCW